MWFVFGDVFLRTDEHRVDFFCFASPCPTFFLLGESNLFEKDSITMSCRPYWPVPGSLRAWVRKKPMEFLHNPTFMEKFGGGSNMIRGLEPGRHVTVSHKDVWKSCLPSQIQPCKETLFANWGPPCRVVVENISVYDESNGHSHRGEVETWQWKTNQWMKMYFLLSMMIFHFDMLVCLPQCTYILEGLKCLNNAK